MSSQGVLEKVVTSRSTVAPVSKDEVSHQIDTKRLVVVMMAVYLSVFIVALVCQASSLTIIEYGR